MKGTKEQKARRDKEKPEQGPEREAKTVSRNQNLSLAGSINENKQSKSMLIFILITANIACFVFAGYLLYDQQRKDENSQTNLANDKKDLEVTGCNDYSLLVGDTVCDDVTNIERCQFDGGDCCLEKKSTPLCQVCTCKMNIDSNALVADLLSHDVKTLVEASEYNDVLIENDVVSFLEVESVDICSTLCLRESGTRMEINSWSFDHDIQKCSCNFVDAILCLVIDTARLESYPLDQQQSELHSGKSFIGFIMLSRTLDCGTFHVDIGPSIFNNPNIGKTLYVPSPKICQNWCDTNSNTSCIGYIWHKEKIFDDGNCAMLLENFHDLTFHACKGLIMGPLLEVDSATKTDVSGKTCFDSSVGDSNEVYSANVLLVAGSTSDDSSWLNVDIVHLDNPNAKCSIPSHFPQLPNHEAIYSGGIVGDNTPIFCGGFAMDGTGVSDKCYTPSSLDPVAFMQEERLESASIIVRRGNSLEEEEVLLWVTGGTDGYFNPLDTTDFVSSSGSMPGPTLPYPRGHHCLVRAQPDNDHQFVFIGGLAGILHGYGQSTRSSFIYDMNLDQWTNGPDIQDEKYAMGCGGILDQFYQGYIIVAGGGGNGYRSIQTTEFIDTRGEMSSWEWKNGPDMPERFFASSIVSWDSTQLFVIGGSTFVTDYSTDIYSFSCHNLDCQWSWLSTQLSYPKTGAAAFLLPDSLIGTYCSLE